MTKNLVFKMKLQEIVQFLCMDVKRLHCEKSEGSLSHT